MKKIVKTAYKRFKNLEKSYEYYEIKKLLANENFCAVENPKPEAIKNILFVIPGMVVHAGGHTSILRLGTKLCNYGYDISYLSYGSQSISEMRNSASLNLEGYKGTFYDYSYIDMLSADIVIATNWKSVYIAKKFRVIRYILYRIMSRIFIIMEIFIFWQSIHTIWDFI